jgi:putative spermidine/putrescine transport system substrate-binding protein
MEKYMNFRVFLGATALAALPVAGAVAQDLPPCENCADAMTIVSWGGAYQTSQLKAYVEPYVAATGIDVVWDESSSDAVAKLRAMYEAGNVTWDLVDVEGPDSQRLCDEGLAMEVDADAVLAPGDDGSTPSEDFEASGALINECFIPQIVFSTTFGYRTDMAEWNGAEPDSVCAIFDTETFPGKRSLEGKPKKNLEWALLCDGVSQDEVYELLETEEGVQRALDKLATIKDDVIWWSAGAETPQLLADGEVVMGSTYNGRLFSVIEEQDQPVKMLWDWQVFDYDGWIVPADLPEDRVNRVMHFLHFATDTQRLADQAKYISYGPARSSSQPLVSTHADLGIEMSPHMPTNPDNQKNYLVNNIEWWADNQDDVESLFQVWLSQ